MRLRRAPAGSVMHPTRRDLEVVRSCVNRCGDAIQDLLRQLLQLPVVLLKPAGDGMENQAGQSQHQARQDEPDGENAA